MTKVLLTGSYNPASAVEGCPCVTEYHPPAHAYPLLTTTLYKQEC